MKSNMNSSFFTPRRILIAIGLLALLFIFRECLKNRTNNNGALDQINVRYDSAPSNLNPYLTVQASDSYTNARIFQTLGDLDPKTTEIKPLIIQQVPQARMVQEGPFAGKIAYDFEILPEAVWDNGTPITGYDYEFSLKIIFDPQLAASKPFIGYFKDLVGLEVDSKNPKKFTAYFNQYYILAIESLCQIPVLPSYNYDPEKLLAKFPIADFIDTTRLAVLNTDADVAKFTEYYKQAKFTNDPNAVSGSGPYRLETMNDQGVILVKKENWWGDKSTANKPLLAAYPKRLVYKVLKDENVVLNMMKTGEIDIIAAAISPGKFLEMQQTDSIKNKYNFETYPALQYNRWLINLSKSKFQDKLVRKAMAHLIDYEHFIKNIRQNMATRTVGPILTNKPYYAKDVIPYDFNIDKAKELLKQAGWSDTDNDGFVDKALDGKKTKLVIETLTPNHPLNLKYAESLTETARLAGIEIKTVVLDLPELSKRTKNNDYETALIGSAFFGGLSDLSQRYHSKYLTPAGDNRSHYVNPAFDKLCEAIVAEMDETKRNAMYVEAQKILHEDLPEIFIMAPTQPVITANKFKTVTSPNRPGYYEHLFQK
jgi:peptide/nickel transport system substrate-binding protein